MAIRACPFFDIAAAADQTISLDLKLQLRLFSLRSGKNRAGKKTKIGDTSCVYKW